MGKNLNSQQQQQLASLHDRILASSEAFLEPEAVADVTGDQVDELLAKSLLLLSELDFATGTDSPILDTAGCRTLAHYQLERHAPSRERAPSRR